MCSYIPKYHSPLTHTHTPHTHTGLVTAGLIADLFRAAQPALLYLVPGVLIPLFVKAILQVSESKGS